MKKLLLLLPIFALLMTSCEDDVPVILDGTLSYDGPNNTSPLFQTGEYEAAARFTPAVVDPYEGKNLEEVSFYLVDLPDRCEVRVYGNGRNDEPGDLLYSADVTTGLIANNWNDHVLATPVEIDGRDLWISIFLDHDRNAQSIGCDSGPAVNNAGDWLFEANDGEWRTFTSRANASINWNIRGVVSE